MWSQLAGDAVRLLESPGISWRNKKDDKYKKQMSRVYACASELSLALVYPGNIQYQIISAQTWFAVG